MTNPPIFDNQKIKLIGAESTKKYGDMTKTFLEKERE
jgi:hypothetical protein